MNWPFLQVSWVILNCSNAVFCTAVCLSWQGTVSNHWRQKYHLILCFHVKQHITEFHSMQFCRQLESINRKAGGQFADSNAVLSSAQIVRGTSVSWMSSLQDEAIVKPWSAWLLGTFTVLIVSVSIKLRTLVVCQIIWSEWRRCRCLRIIWKYIQHILSSP